MEARTRATTLKNTVVLDGLLNYCLFAPLTLIFWYGNGILFEILVLDGKTDPLPRATVVLVASTAFEVWAALEQNRWSQVSNDILRDSGYQQYFLLTRFYNYLMGLADVFMFLSIQTFYTEYVGPVEAEVHARWAVSVLVAAFALRVSRSLVTSPFVVGLDENLEKAWFDFSLYFKTKVRLIGECRN